MKYLIIPLFLVFSLLLNGCSSKVRNENNEYIMANNFSFYMDYGSCLVDTYDSSNGIFTQQMCHDQDPVTVITKLSDQQLSVIFTEITQIKFFEYPDIFVITPDKNTTAITTEGHYNLRVINGDYQKQVICYTYYFQNLPNQAQQYKDVVVNIWDILRKQPEVMNLPKRGCGCL
jgi:hypothetical protein